MIGPTLSHYRILHKLGAGGMGEVYLAEDTRLERRVALKVVAEELVADEGARRRLVREARLASTLNHPHVCTIYEVGEADGQTYIAMEFAEGRSLGDQIPSDGFPLETALRYGLQLADALWHAHEHHIVHRDLKSGNVVITTDGRVKVLDFGLATRSHLAPADAAATQEATRTAAGAIVGTPAYMAPEVLGGVPASEASDVWSLGVVLYEMATGALPFRGKSAFEVTAAILKEAPARMPPRIAGGLRAVIQRCLEKEPSHRYRGASEVRAALETLQSNLRAPAEARTWRGLRPPRYLVVALIAVLALGGAWMGWRLTRPAPELKQRQLTAATFPNPIEFGAISPDGRNLAVAAILGASLQIRGVDSGESAPVGLPDGFEFDGPFPNVQWFPDGSRLLVSGQIHGMPSVWVLPTLAGGPRRILGDGEMATISPDGSQIAYIRAGKTGAEIWRTGPNGEDPQLVVASDSSGSISTWAVWSPGGRRLAYARARTSDPQDTGMYLESCDMEGRRRLIFSGTAEQGMHYYTVPLWLPDGRLLFGLTDPPPNPTGLNLWSIHVDPRSGEPSGKPRRITRWQRISLLSALGISKDGRRLLVATMRYQSDCYVGGIAGGDSLLKDVKRLTLDDRMDVQPAWTPDGRAIVFTSDRNGTPDIFEQELDGAVARPLITGPGEQYAPQVSRDGAWLLYMDAGNFDRQGFVRLMRVPLVGGPPEVVLNTQPLASYRQVSHGDSTWALSEVDHGETVFTAFQPGGGRGRELGRVGARVSAKWDLSPGGDQVAVVDPLDPVPRIRVLSFADHSTREVPIDPEVRLASISWIPDGGGWFVVSAEGVAPWNILRVTLDGRTTPLLPPQTWMYDCAASPDGHHLVFTSNTGDGALWLLEDF